MMTFAEAKKLKRGDRVKYADGTLGIVREITVYDARSGYIRIRWDDDPPEHPRGRAAELRDIAPELSRA